MTVHLAYDMYDSMTNALREIATKIESGEMTEQQAVGQAVPLTIEAITRIRRANVKLEHMHKESCKRMDELGERLNKLQMTNEELRETHVILLDFIFSHGLGIELQKHIDTMGNSPGRGN